MYMQIFAGLCVVFKMYRRWHNEILTSYSCEHEKNERKGSIVLSITSPDQYTLKITTVCVHLISCKTNSHQYERKNENILVGLNWFILFYYEKNCHCLLYGIVLRFLFEWKNITFLLLTFFIPGEKILTIEHHRTI